MPTIRLSPTLLALALAAVLATGGGDPRSPGIRGAQAATAPTAAASVPTRPNPDFAQLVEREGPTVAFISVRRPVQGIALPGLEDGGPLGEFLRRFGVPVPEGRPAPEAGGVGSGFIVSSDGYILTNAHVVAGAAEVNVRLADRREFAAKVVGIDRRTDVAVVKIDANELPTVRIGDPSQLRVGEWVAAIGAPFGLDNTVTAGIVSAKSRSLPSDTIVPFIQTDVAVNPGNSGGPLFNMAGEVIGINSQIYSRTGGYMGLSFAIPIDVAMQVKEQLVTQGKVTRGRIGVGIQEVSRPLAESFGLPAAEGALVSKVEADGPAARAGLRPGDVILAWNGQTVASANGLPYLVASTKPGDTANMAIWRDGQRRTLEVVVGELPGEGAPVADGPAAPQGKLGVAVRTLTPEEARRIDASGGLVVERASGAAARAGIRPGDVILGVNGRPVGSLEELRSAIEAAGSSAAVLLQRGDSRIFVPVQIG
jgi:serine protease Do